ncbi:suppressor of fused homolog [Ctenocephalides felis]|uniref:suppressor of fused homolog n=1 Tax=Ctenocephalides felis TaxID=7515 RepID=UPI000E6E3FA3|nr:suppressor of fused homolog [Ctenocephalides felis]
MDEKERVANVPQPPAGLQALYSRCRELYPDQPNPLQVTAIVKYWLGGPDPLDYISMYANAGNAAKKIPPHWHYISFGLSDLHGDGRVHELSTMPGGSSGFGFELTFRLQREANETTPPTWPAALLQSLAKYVFQTGNRLCAGDHVSWHCALDNSDSRLRHMLMAADPQLASKETPFGVVDFIQVVGICAEELQASQKWLGAGVLRMLSEIPSSGGPYLITNMQRSQSIFEINPKAHEIVERGFETDGSNLSGVSARCSWIEIASNIKQEKNQNIEENVKKLNVNDLQNSITSSASNSNFDIKFEPLDQYITQYLNGIHITFNLEAGHLLPLAIRGRVRHGRHFTFKSILDDTAITLVAESVTDTQVTPLRPYALLGNWLQVLIPHDLEVEMVEAFDVLSHPEKLELPKTFSWPAHRLAFTIMSDVL